MESVNYRFDDLEIGGKWTQGGYFMRSAQGEVQAKIWKRHTGKDGCTWLTTIDDSGDNIIYHNPKDSGSRGFGGAELAFHLDDGTSINLKGPWASNSEALFEATGIDLRSKHTTWGCIGRWRDWDYSSNSADSRTVIGGLIYFDATPLVGNFERIRLIAEEMSHERDELLFYYSESHGGSSCACALPYYFGVPIRDRGRLGSIREARKKEEPYWEKYYQEFPHLDHRREYMSHFKPHPRQSNEMVRDGKDPWNA